MASISLITVPFKGTEIRDVNHPERGMVMMAVDVLRAAGYKIGKGGAHPLLKHAGVPEADKIQLLGTTLADSSGGPARFGSATFLTRAGVHQLLMASTKPSAKEFRDWLAGEVVVAIEDTGGYLLNEAARETAKADARETVPLPEGIAEMRQAVAGTG
ncbi:Bro-N domain-containing protein [Ancylobacter oerskovii]|uniref:Bro-N domain-containing protein n=1 Tax=Ancylobacter oerskovii TaxID=459519 RepID=A0ABW4YYR9_9HYPH|nr:BRO family protein [Ancylobacter oerskovii]MBS7546408.1 hypothetical protein [Ancylobacter oerskovii]